MVENERVTFEELMRRGVLEVGDGYRAENSELGGTGLPFLRQGLIDPNGVIDFGGAERFHVDASERAAHKSSRPHDVLVVTKGWSTGRLAYMRPGYPSVVYSPHVSYWRSQRPDVLDPAYLRQWSRSATFAAQLESLAGTCTLHPYLSLTNQARVLIELPAPSVQRRIAAILGALDDKIELNRGMNRTLEELAQAIFKSWFIDFDGHDDLVDSEIGPVPRGWAVRPIGDVVRVAGGSTPSTKEASYWDDGEHAWATPKDLSGVTVPVLLGTERKITNAGVASISSGLMPAGTFLLSSRAPIGYTAIAQVPVAVNQGFIAIPPGGALPSSFLLFWTRLNMEAIEGRAGGTTFAEISKSAFRPMLVVVPPPANLAGYQRLVDPMIARITAAEGESRTLGTLRDALLPKLISGELRVPDAEAVVSEAL